MTRQVFIKSTRRTPFVEFGFLVRLKVVALGIIWALAADAFSANDGATAEISTGPYVPVYPIRASSDNRHLVDQNNTPFMIVGDSPHSLIGRMSKSDAEFYMANRQR
jgi:hypothetical protein